MRTRIAMALRRMADRLAPAPAGDCGSGATWINCGGAGIRIDSATQGQVIVGNRFDAGQGWTPA